MLRGQSEGGPQAVVLVLGSQNESGNECLRTLRQRIVGPAILTVKPPVDMLLQAGKNEPYVTLPTLP